MTTTSLFMLISNGTMSPFMLTKRNDVPFYAYHFWWKRCPLLCLSTLEIAFYAYQRVEKTSIRVYSKQGLFSERSVRFEFSLPPKHSMSTFRFISLIYSRYFLLYVFYVETVPVPKTAFANKLFPNSGVNHGVRSRCPLPSPIPGRRPN